MVASAGPSSESPNEPLTIGLSCELIGVHDQLPPITIVYGAASPTVLDVQVGTTT